MPPQTLPLDQLLEHLERLAQDALPLWDIPTDAQLHLINVSENVTYWVEAPGGYRAILRVHRAGYHTRRAIECELAWLDALAADGQINVPRYIVGRDGRAIQQAHTPGLDAPRFIVLFAHLDGTAPDETQDITPGFEELGRIAARCHDHVMRWQKPQPFERLTWDSDAVFGASPTWGNWRDAPGVTTTRREVLEVVEKTIRHRLEVYGKAPERYNLIHADMRLANLLVDAQITRLIDFDDCGMGWLMYDFAAAISFIEDDPRVPQFKAAWLAGYRNIRALPAEDEAEIDTMIMLRRMALLAWIGSHIEAPEPQALAPDFAENTVTLGMRWLRQVAG